MEQNIYTNWTRKELFTFRLFSVYFLLYLIFISQPWGSYYQVFNIYQYSGKLIEVISKAFVHFINFLFLHKPLNSNIDISADTYWGYTLASSIFIIAVVSAFVWSFISKQKSYTSLFNYLHVIARYYLSFSLLNYGFSKIFWNQFFIPDWGLITNLSDLAPQHVLWSFMASSKSYQFFGGLMEIIPAILLLFRRTSMIGALLAIPVLVNVLMLNIGYDVGLKLILFHLIIFALFILTPDIKRLQQFFFSEEVGPRNTMPPNIFNKMNSWLYYSLKFGFILLIVFTDLKFNIERSNTQPGFPDDSILGMQRVKEFYVDNAAASKKFDITGWKKFAIYPDNQMIVQFLNDSIARHHIKSDTSLALIEVLPENDSSFSKLHYTRVSPHEWLFEGILNKDSVHFISTKMDLNKTKLRTDYGKTKWVY